MKKTLLKNLLIVVVFLTTITMSSQEAILTIVDVAQKGTITAGAQATFTITYKTDLAAGPGLTGNTFQFRRQLSGSADQITGYISLDYQYTNGANNTVDVSFTWPATGHPSTSALPTGEYYELRLFNANPKTDYDLAPYADHYSGKSISPGSGSFEPLAGWIGLNDVVVTLEGTAGVEDYQQLKGVSINPNPAVDQLYITCPEGSSVAVYNLMGVKVKSVDNVSKSYQLSVTDLAAGLYIVKVVQNGQFYSKKIQIK